MWADILHVVDIIGWAAFWLTIAIGCVKWLFVKD